MLIINGMKDLAIPYEGALYKGSLEETAPIEFGIRYFREKYNCDKDNLIITFQEFSENENDFTVCSVSESSENCKTEVINC